MNFVAAKNSQVVVGEVYRSLKNQIRVRCTTHHTSAMFCLLTAKPC